MGNSQAPKMDTRGDRSVMKKKIVVKAPALSASGYGEQARFALRALQDYEDLYDLFLINIPWGKTGNAILSKEEKTWITSLVAKTQHLAQQNNGKLHFDVSLQITIPNEFEKMADVNIGYTAGIETTKVSPQWLDKANQMDKIIVPSNHSKNVFEQTVYKAKRQDTGQEVDFCLKVPVHVCSFPASVVEFTIPEIQLQTEWNFLSVAQWGPRKNVEATIRNFVKEFKEESDVGLVLKLNTTKNSVMDKEFTKKRATQFLQSLKKEVPDYKCKVYLLHGNLTDSEMRGLYNHPQIKAFVTTTHGEGFGLPMFDAAISGLPIVAPAWSSYVDFLYAPKKEKDTGKIKNKAHFVKVDFELKTVQKEAVWDGVVQADSQWCFVKDHSVRNAMREMKKNHTSHLSAAKKLSAHILENVSLEKQNSLMGELVTGEKIQKVSVDDLPKISVITSVFNGDEFIREFLEDMTSQTIFREKCELILMNANSPGNEEEVIMEFVEKFPENIVYKKLETDPGIYGCWNKAIELSTGEFITNANLDDRRSPEFLFELAKALVTNSEVGVVYADNLLTHQANETWSNNTATQTYPSEEFSLDAMLRGNPPHCMPMWRKSLHQQHGYFSEEYKSASDWEFWLRCAFSGTEMKKVSKPLGLYYFNPKGMSTNQEHNEWKRKEEKEIFKKYVALHRERFSNAA